MDASDKTIEDLDRDGPAPISRRRLLSNASVGGASAVVGGAGVIAALVDRFGSAGPVEPGESARGSTPATAAGGAHDAPVAGDEASPTVPDPAPRADPAPAGGPGFAPIERPSRAQAAHLLRRATFGPTLASVRRLIDEGVTPWLDRQFDGGRPDRGMEGVLDGFDTLSWPASRRRDDARANPSRRHAAAREISYATFLHAVRSDHQLREVMVDVWCNHFHAGIDKGPVGYVKADEVAAFRRLALGRFGDLLRASAQSVAMLTFLDNRGSRVPEPNENYARELLELHTLGVDAGYTESDVVNAARVFTGWTERDLEFAFEPKWHFDGPVRVFGWSSPAASGPRAVDRGLALLDHLARHPSTARHVARKLAVRFVSDDPPDDLVDDLAGVYLANDTAIEPVLRALFRSEPFWTSAGAKIKRPFELVVGVLRATDARLATPPHPPRPVEPADELELLGSSDMMPATSDEAPGLQAAKRIDSVLAAMGQRLFAETAPTGYPDHTPDWVHTQGLQSRWEQMARLTVAVGDVLDVDPAPLAGGAETAGAMVDSYFQALVHRAPSPSERRAIVAATERDADAFVPVDERDSVLRHVLALVLSSPSHQVR